MRSARQWSIAVCLSVLVSLPARVLAESDSSNLTPFPVPVGLESAVEFWQRVFTEFSQSQMIFFDPLDLSKIYEVSDVGEDHRSDRFIKAERVRVAAKHGVDVERVQTQRGIKERTAEGIKRSGRYLEQIKKIFTERGLPEELVYLPIVESSYDINARSSVGAVGIWQF
ncbi:MAG TPA: transglycosylase SLT domain-containing protein, partial [Terriglobales bacterium]|nr:transglycosylase SLT domain-containing protein [Terriglobales bacterium]